MEDAPEAYQGIAAGILLLIARLSVHDHLSFEKGKPMLEETRYGPHFDVQGDRSVHFGLFDCQPAENGDCTPSGGCC
jgi:hypothetical protein